MRALASLVEEILTSSSLVVVQGLKKSEIEKILETAYRTYAYRLAFGSAVTFSSTTLSQYLSL
jgi:hypothetical protein